MSGQILRDADLSQALSPAWIQQTVFGLAAEWGKSPLEALKAEEVFHSNLKFCTVWAKNKFPNDAIQKKAVEARELLELLE